MLNTWLIMQILANHQLNMYYTYHNDDHQDKYCLLYYVNDQLYDYLEVPANLHQIISYCFRHSLENLIVTNDNIYKRITFEELQSKNISSQLLLSWSAPIDLAENYEIFLRNTSNVSLFYEEMFFDNCTIPWFGLNCRFTFDSITEKSFNEFVTIYFRSQPQIKIGEKITCYKHLLTCETSLSCLDWREICDRKIDCFDGSDEFYCWQLELNECADNEYRCHNGQCIPMEFFHDISLNPDCLDRTDELRGTNYPDRCHRDPAFRCEEHTCRSGIDEFPCGNGQCSTKFDSTCHNGRDNIFTNDSCSNAINCRIDFYDAFDNMWCQEFCSEIDCIEEYCSSLLKFSTLSLLKHVQLLFNNSQFTIEPNEISLSIYVCYDEKLCRDFLPATIYLNDSSCRYFHELGLEKLDTFFYAH
ncbi:unnamed protein product [Rotaria sp. Silwood2]|nr:unnamed protein product [Rotaria sp. Silwood2]